MPLYFAYGSNMDAAAMAARCPGSRQLGCARLARHRLVVMAEGYLSLLRDPRREVWGMLWTLPFGDLPALDRYEEVATGLYAKLHHPVIGPDGARRALVYVGRNSGPGTARPGYLEGVLAAARAADLPLAHLGEIERLMAAAGRYAKGSPVPGTPVAVSRMARPAVTPMAHSPLDRARRTAEATWRWEP